MRCEVLRLALVCSLGPQMLSVNAALPVSTVSELIAYAKANSGRLSKLATEGGGTPASTAQTIRQEQAQWRALGKELGVEPQ